jgi:hypothetical protein
VNSLEYISYSKNLSLTGPKRASKFSNKEAVNSKYATSFQEVSTSQAASALQEWRLSSLPVPSHPPLPLSESDPKKVAFLMGALSRERTDAGRHPMSS